MSYNKQVIKTVKLGKVNQTTIQLSRKDKNLMHIDEISNIVQSIENEANNRKEDVKVMVRGLNIDKWYTLKSFQNDLDSDVVDEYLHGLVQDTVKFNDFIQVHLTIFKQ
jgi:hypothetical protein